MNAMFPLREDPAAPSVAPRVEITDLDRGGDAKIVATCLGDCCDGVEREVYGLVEKFGGVVTLGRTMGRRLE